MVWRFGMQFCVAAPIATVQKRTESIDYLPILGREVFGSIIARIAIPRRPMNPVLGFPAFVSDARIARQV
jgi:hypothetical protein